MWWFMKKLCGDSNVGQNGCAHIAKLAKNHEHSNIVEELQKAMHDNKSFRAELFSLWDDNSDAVGVVFLVTRYVNFDSFMLEIMAYSKYGYKASRLMLSFKSVDELFEWFQKKDTPTKCSRALTDLYEILMHPD